MGTSRGATERGRPRLAGCLLAAISLGTGDLPAQLVQGRFPQEQVNILPGTDRLRLHWARGQHEPLLQEAREALATPGLRRRAAPHILRYLTHLELQRDRQAAGRSLEASMHLLRHEPQASARLFAVVLDRQPDARDFHRCAMALTPLLNQHRAHLQLRLTLLRALDAVGKTAEARQQMKDALALLPQEASSDFKVVAVICRLRQAQPFRALALQLMQRSGLDRASDRRGLFLRYEVARDLCRDAKQVEALAREIVHQVPSGGLNNFVWYLMTREDSAGRFPELALRGAERMLRDGELGYPELDTVALAMFRNGRLQDALRYQRQAIAAGGDNDPDYRRRLQQYEQACAQPALARPGR